MHPAMTVLLAATVGWSAPDERFVAVMTAHVAEVADLDAADSAEPAPTVATVTYYYERIAGVPVPETPVLITYDPTLPIFRTKP